MRKRLYIISCASLVLCAALRFASARGVETILYNGGSPRTDVRSRWGAWGGGEVDKNTEIRYYPEATDAKESIFVRTYDYFQGVRIDVDPPVDLTPYRERGYVIIRLRFADFQPGQMPGGSPGGGIGGGSFGSSRMGGAGALGGAGGPGFPGGGFPGGPGAGMPTEAPVGLETLRVVLYLERGALGTQRFEVDFDDTDEQGWTTVRIPLKRFRPSAGASGRLKRVVIAGDRQDEFYLAQVKLVQDVDEMSMQVLVNGKPASMTTVGNKRIVRVEVIEDQETDIEADVNAGSADADVYWNLNEEANLPVERGLRLQKKIFESSGEFDGWVQVEDARRSDEERKEPWRLRLRIIVRKPS